MESASLAEIKIEIDRRAALIGASGDPLPTYGRTEDFGRPHIEVDSRGYHWVTVERGNELKRVTTRDLDQLLYTVFEAVTFSLACRYEVHHRVRGEDCRRQIFRHQVELLARLNPGWAERGASHQREILRDNPFIDR
jgi:hypothetical protein